MLAFSAAPRGPHSSHCVSGLLEAWWGELFTLSMPQFPNDKGRIAAIGLDPSPELSLVLLAPSISWTLSCCLN